MLALYILFAAVLGLCCLVMLVLLAGVLVAALYGIYPWLASTFLAMDLNQPVHLPQWATRAHQVEEPPVRVVLARSPLANTEYLVGVTRKTMVWTMTKQNARLLLLSDRLAQRAWVNLAEKEGSEVFICLRKQ